MHIKLNEMLKIFEKEQTTLFTIKGNPNTWYYRTGDTWINIGGGNPETEKPLTYLKGKTIIIEDEGHIFRPSKRFHYWKQSNAGTYELW